MSGVRKNYGLLFLKLILCIVLDLIGIASVFLVFTEFLDLIWAPISALLLMVMFRGKKGKLAAVIGFTEEIIPFFTDFIPTFTIFWIYEAFFEKTTGIDVSNKVNIR